MRMQLLSSLSSTVCSSEETEKCFLHRLIRGTRCALCFVTAVKHQSFELARGAGKTGPRALQYMDL